MDYFFTWVCSVDISKGLLLLIAAFGAYIAFQQWKTNRMKLQFELYEKRLSIYNVIMSAINETLWDAEVSQKTISNIRTARAESKFLVPDSVFKKVDMSIDMIELIQLQRSKLDHLLATDDSYTDEKIEELRSNMINREKVLEEFTHQITEEFMKVLKFNDA